MDKESSTNTMEKQRLRDSMAEQVRRFIESGGRIEVLDSPVQRAARAHRSAWHGNTANALLE